MPLETHGEQNAASAEWWGDFVPIDQWKPPRVRHQFKDLEFRKYDMGPETWIDTLDSHVGDSTPDVYDRSFAGLDDYLEELLGMFNQYLIEASGQSPMTESVNDEEEVDDLMDEDSPSYDLGWNLIPAAPQDSASPSGGSTITNCDDDSEPAYDLGWGDAAPTSGADFELGEGPTTPISDDEVQAGDGPMYDLRWESASPVDNPWMKMMKMGPRTTLGGGPELMITLKTCKTIGSVFRVNGQHHDIIDLTNDNDNGPSYDLRWGVQANGKAADVKSGSSSPLSPPPSSLDPMDVDHDYMAFRINRQMKTIGNDLWTDEHVHAVDFYL
ncbi:hypothetical protein EV702DRAFT_1207504 [Suillus placidus]|uniref:Uncharacterized protein n=1 Tax=Suillus placidus TaxID=48579 RepID=A0A9P7CV54_9AGAM|nr:hypothetical protein EV702DRAFT_1207504 [Suillus placidus]